MAKEKTEKTEKSAYELAKEKLEKDYGSGIIRGANDAPRYENVVSTGSLKFDIATNIGGIPLTGCIIEILGWESSGKSTFTLQIVAAAQKATGKKALLIDAENSFDMIYAAKLGVNLDELDVVQTFCGEDAYNMAEILADSGAYCMVVIDSQTGLKPRAVIDNPVGKSHLGLEARMMSDAVVRMLAVSTRNKLPILFISQLREKIGVMFGSPETTSGGHALKFYAHMRVEVRRSIEREGGVEIANKTKVKVIKNKFAAPFGSGEGIMIEYGRGVNREQEIIDLAVDMAIIKKAGSWFSYNDSQIGQGETSVQQFLADNPEVAVEIENKVIDKLKNVKNESIIDGSV